MKELRNSSYAKVEDIIKGDVKCPLPVDNILNYEKSIKALDQTIEAYKQGKIKYTVYDTETSSLDENKGEIIFVTICNDVLPLGVGIPLFINNDYHLKYDGEKKNIDINLSYKEIGLLKIKIKEMLEVVPIVGHNLKFDIKFSVVFLGVDINKISIYADTHILAFQLYNKLKPLGLKDLCKETFNITEDWDSSLTSYISLFRKVEDRSYKNIPTYILGNYAILDAYYNKMLLEHFNTKIPEETKHIIDILYKLIIVFSDLEIKGIYCDTNMINFISDKVDPRIHELYNLICKNEYVKKFIEDRLIILREANSKKRKPLQDEELLIEAFNPSSAAMLSVLFFDKRYFGFPINNEFISEKTKKPSTSEEAINWLLDSKFLSSGEKDFIKLLMSYRDCVKLKTTYIDNLKQKLVDNTFKPNYNLAVVITGRLSSNFHTMPKKSPIKRIFTSRWRDKGGIILTADMSQLELRILASIAKEDKMIESYKKGIDVHASTAAAIYKKEIKDITKDERGIAKSVNFGIAYGQTVSSLANDLGITEQEAKNIFEKFFNNFVKVGDWIEKQHKFVLENGYIVTKYNRYIPIVNAFYKSRKEVEEAKRRSVNYVIQSSASDCVIDSILNTYNCNKANNLKSILVGTVHDSVQYDVYPGELLDIIKQVKLSSEDYLAKKNDWLLCPLKMDFGIGSSWGGCLESTINIKEDNTMIIKSSGARKDILQLETLLKQSYGVNKSIISEKELKDSDFEHYDFVRDIMKQSVVFKVSK